MGLLTFPEGHIESQAPGLIPELGAYAFRISYPKRVFKHSGCPKWLLKPDKALILQDHLLLLSPKGPGLLDVEISSLADPHNKLLVTYHSFLRSHSLSPLKGRQENLGFDFGQY